MKTFEEFYKDHIDSCAVYSEKMTAKWAWEEATLAERERCAKVCSSLWDLSHDPRARMYAAKCADAIRNPQSRGAV